MTDHFKLGNAGRPPLGVADLIDNPAADTPVPSPPPSTIVTTCQTPRLSPAQSARRRTLPFHQPQFPPTAPDLVTQVPLVPLPCPLSRPHPGLSKEDISTLLERDILICCDTAARTLLLTSDRSAMFLTSEMSAFAIGSPHA